MSLRPSAEFAKKIFGGRELVIAEIGVHKGENAKSLLDNLNIRKMYLIDPYESNRGYDKVQEENCVDPLTAGAIAHEYLADYPNIIWIQKTSLAAIADIDEILDYAYIDGDHRYENVKDDAKAYYPLVRSGGVLAGHDYHQFDRPDIHDGVTRAVDEFGAENSYVIQGALIDWWILKR